MHWRIWKSEVSWFFGSTGVIWATAWLGWIATSSSSAGEVAVSREWCASQPRTESHEDRRRKSKLFDSLPSGRQAPVKSESLPETCRPKPGLNGDALFEKCDESQESLGAGMRGCAFSEPARWQRGGQRYPRRNVPLPVLKSAQKVF